MKPIRVKLSVAAEMLGCSYRKIQYDVAAGKVPSITTDTGRKFVPMEWIEKQKFCALVGDAAAKQLEHQERCDLKNGMRKDDTGLSAWRPTNTGFGTTLEFKTDYLHLAISLPVQWKSFDKRKGEFIAPRVQIDVYNAQGFNEEFLLGTDYVLVSWIRGATSMLLPEYGLRLKRYAIKGVFIQLTNILLELLKSSDAKTQVLEKFFEDINETWSADIDQSSPNSIYNQD